MNFQPMHFNKTPHASPRPLEPQGASSSRNISTGASARPTAQEICTPGRQLDSIDVCCSPMPGSGASQGTPVSDGTGSAAKNLVAFSAQQANDYTASNSSAAAILPTTRKRLREPADEANIADGEGPSVVRQRVAAPSPGAPQTPPAAARRQFASPWPRMREPRPQGLGDVTPASMNLLAATSLAPNAGFMAHLPPGSVRPQVVAAPYGAAGSLLAPAPENDAPVLQGEVAETERWLDQNAMRLAGLGLQPAQQRRLALQLPRSARADLLKHLPALMAAGYAPDDVGGFVLHRGNGSSLPALARVLPLFAARHYTVVDVQAFLSTNRVRQRLAAFEADPNDFDALSHVERQFLLQHYWYV